MSTSVTATVSAEDNGTDWLLTKPGVDFDIFPGDGGDATITLQRRDPDDTATVYDIKDYTAGDDAEIGRSTCKWEYRLHVKTGNYTSGDIFMSLCTP